MFKIKKNLLDRENYFINNNNCIPEKKEQQFYNNFFLIAKVITVFLFIIVNKYSIAAPNQEFGYVNLVDVMMLHPTMQYFDLSSKRFSLKAFKGINVEERIEENKVRIRKEINKWKEKLEELDGKTIEIKEIYKERKEHLLKPGERLALMTKTRRKKYDEELAKLDSKYDSDLHQIRTESYPIKQIIKKLEESSDYSGYSTVKETRDFFSMMLDDVFEAINVVSKRKNTSFVFNSSANLNYIDTPSNTNIQLPNNLSSFFDNTFKKEIKERGESEAKVSVGSIITQWLYSRDSVFKFNVDSRLSMFVLNGGINLTPDVVDYIYEKHKVGKIQREFIKEYFKKIISTDNQDFRDF